MKSMLLFFIINIILGLINFENYMIKVEQEYEEEDKKNYNVTSTLDHFKLSDQMNVALHARSYDEMSDYFASKNNLDNGFQIIKDGKIVPPKKGYPKVLGYRKKIRIGYTDMSEEKGKFYLNYVKKMLNDTYEFIFTQKNPDYLLFSYFGCNHTNNIYNNTIKIAIYEENFMPSFNEEDYTFGVGHIIYLDRYFRKATILKYLKNLTNEDFKKARMKALNGPKRDKFCGAVLNDEKFLDHFREKFVKVLSKYKRVENGGDIDNNIGRKIEKNDEIEFFSNYRFSIAFEKNTADGFATDHIIKSLLAGTIPIYYGDFLIEEYINPKTFILVKDEYELKEKIKLIRDIDKSDKLYREFLMQEEVLVDEKVVEKREKEEKEYWSHIFKQDKYDARRIDHVRIKTRKCSIKTK